MKVVDDAVEKKGDIAQPVRVLLKTLLDEARALESDATLSTEARSAATTILTQMGVTFARFTETQATAAAVWIVEDLTVFKDEDYEVPLSKVFGSCNNETTCTARYRETQKLLDVVNLLRRVLNQAI